jgi:hypothetical protein
VLVEVHVQEALGRKFARISERGSPALACDTDPLYPAIDRRDFLVDQAIKLPAFGSLRNVHAD